MGKADDGLRAILRTNMRRAQWTTIETGDVAGGVPDCEYCFPGIAGPGAQGWIECKATKAWAVRFRPGQVGWLFQRWRYGGRAFVAVRRRGLSRGAGYDELWLVPARLVKVLADDGLRAVQDASWRWVGGPSNWDWAEVEAALCCA